MKDSHDAEDMVRVFSQISFALNHGDSPLLTRIEGIVDDAADASDERLELQFVEISVMCAPSL